MSNVGIARRRRHRRWRRAGLGAAAAVVLLGAWAAIDAVRIERRLASARSALSSVAGDTGALASAARRPAVVAKLRSAANDADAAAGASHRSVPLRVAGIVPALGAQRRGVERLGQDVRDAARDLATALEVADRVAGARSAPPDAPLVPVEGVPPLRDAVADAARTLRRTTRGDATLVGPIADARRRYDALATEHGRSLQDAADALGVARTFAGADRPRRFLVLGQNNAEMRASGMALSYAVVRSERGRFRVERRGSVDDLTLRQPAAIDPPSDGTAQLFGSLQPTLLWQSINGTADWPWTGRAALAMYERATGERLDGVLGVDVVALAGILRVTGPVRAEGIPGSVSAGNAPRLLLRDLYDRLPPGSDQGPRREAVAGVASAVVDALAARPPDPVRLAQVLANAAAGGHLRVYSADPSEQDVLARLGPGDGPDGPTADTAGRTFTYAVENGNGTKLDSFLDVTVRFDVRTTPAGTAVVRTTIAARNSAPAGAAPSYVLGPNEGLDHPPGRYDGRVYLWAPAGSTLEGSLDDAGLRAASTVLLVSPGAAGSSRFETVLPGAARGDRLRLRLVPQPRLRPARIEVRINGRTVHSGEWRGTIDRAWEIPGA